MDWNKCVSSNLTQCRYIHQVTSCALYIKKADAYLNYTTTCKTLPALPMGKSLEKHPMFVFWNLILHLELILLEFFKSIRKGDLKLCTQVLKKFTPCIFILDHYNYPSWLPVHLNETANLHKTHPAVYEECVKRKLTVQKSKIKFSKNTLEHNHEQMNAKIKEEGWRCNWSDRK